MDKNLKLSLISILVSTSLVVAWRSFGAFFKGSGVSFVIMLVALSVLVYFFVADSYVRSRVRDLFIITIALTVLELVVFCGSEFGWIKDVKSIETFNNFQTFLSIFGLIYFAYIIFRFIYEGCSLRYGFIEGVLGNGGVKHTKQAKARKEFVNGSLEDKPNNQRKSNEETKPEGEE